MCKAKFEDHYKQRIKLKQRKLFVYTTLRKNRCYYVSISLNPYKPSIYLYNFYRG